MLKSNNPILILFSNRNIRINRDIDSDAYNAYRKKHQRRMGNNWNLSFVKLLDTGSQQPELPMLEWLEELTGERLY